MSAAFEMTDHEAPVDGRAETLVQRFWLSFIRSIAELHLADEYGSDKRELLEGRLAENVDKAVAAALQGLPPHQCGSFGRAALSVMRDRHKPDSVQFGFQLAGASPGTSP